MAMITILYRKKKSRTSRSDKYWAKAQRENSNNKPFGFEHHKDEALPVLLAAVPSSHHRA
jgi:hypothetical protein